MFTKERKKRTKESMGYIETHRRRAGLTTKEVADLLHMSAGYVRNIEWAKKLTNNVKSKVAKLESLPDVNLAECTCLKSFLHRYMIRENVTTEGLAEELVITTATAHALIHEPLRLNVTRLRVALKNMRLNDEEKQHLKKLYFNIHDIE